MPGIVVGVASERDVLVLDAQAPPDAVLSLLADRGVAGKQLHVFGGRTTIVISRENLHDEDRLRDALQARLPGATQLVDGLGAVSVVGAGINATYANVIAGTEALARAGVPPSGTATSSFRITWMIPRDRTNEAVGALHDRFIDSRPVAVP